MSADGARRGRAPRLHGLRQTAWLCLAVLSLTATLQAEPYLAVRYGYKCSQCHFNPTGGGKRNRFGTVFSQSELPTWILSSGDLGRFLVDLGRSVGGGEGDGQAASAGSGEDSGLNLDLENTPTFYSGYPFDLLSFGGDFRVSNRTTIRGADDISNSFDVNEGNLYLSVEFLDGILSGYFDETVAPGGATSREAYALLRGPWDSYLKAGRMMLPYGLRLQDDNAFIREVTGFNYGVQDLGVEVGMEPGPFSFSLAMSNGTQGSSDDNKDKQISGIASFIQRYWRIGAQATWNNNPSPRGKRVAFGGFAGLQLGKFTLLGEIDHIIDELDLQAGDETQRKLLLYGAIYYHLLKGLNLITSYDYSDPDLSESDDSIVRVSAGVEYFPVQFLQLRAFYRFRDETSDSPRDNESELTFEVHLYF